MCDLTNPDRLLDNSGAWQADGQDSDAEREQRIRMECEAELWDLDLLSQALREAQDN
jgi:hypothetical protein